MRKRKTAAKLPFCNQLIDDAQTGNGHQQRGRVARESCKKKKRSHVEGFVLVKSPAGGIV